MQTWGLTDPGNIRQQNQDSYAIVPFGRDRVLMIVCDGMGGAKSGNVASSLAVEVFTDEVRRTQRPGMTPEKAAAMLRSAARRKRQKCSAAHWSCPTAPSMSSRS